jgi:choline dehydrogenase-like flavoprotein
MAISGTYTAPRSLSVGDDVTVPIWHTDLRDNIAFLFEWAVKGAVTSVSAAYTVTTADRAVLCAGASAYTVTLYTAASNNGRRILIKNTATATRTIDGAGAETIDGAATYVLGALEGVLLESDGTNWHVIGTAGAGGGENANSVIGGQVFS